MNLIKTLNQQIQTKPKLKIDPSLFSNTISEKICYAIATKDIILKGVSQKAGNVCVLYESEYNYYKSMYGNYLIYAGGQNQ